MSFEMEIRIFNFFYHDFKDYNHVVGAENILRSVKDR